MVKRKFEWVDVRIENIADINNLKLYDKTKDEKSCKTLTVYRQLGSENGPGDRQKRLWIPWIWRSVQSVHRTLAIVAICADRSDSAGTTSRVSVFRTENIRTKKLPVRSHRYGGK